MASRCRPLYYRSETVMQGSIHLCYIVWRQACMFGTENTCVTTQEQHSIFVNNLASSANTLTRSIYSVCWLEPQIVELLNLSEKIVSLSFCSYDWIFGCGNPCFGDSLAFWQRKAGSSGCRFLRHYFVGYHAVPTTSFSMYVAMNDGRD